MVGYGFVGFSLARPLGELAAKPTERVGFADGAGLVEWGGFPSPQSPMATAPLEYKRSLWFVRGEGLGFGRKVSHLIYKSGMEIWYDNSVVCDIFCFFGKISGNLYEFHKTFR